MFEIIEVNDYDGTPLGNRFELDGVCVAGLAADGGKERPYDVRCGDDFLLYTNREAAVIAHAMLSGLQHVCDLPANISETLKALEKFANS